jgi:hypothetical protein
VKNELLAVVVVVSAILLCWIVLRDQRRKGPRQASGYDGSPSSDSGGENGGHGWFGGHSHSGGD